MLRATPYRRCRFSVEAREPQVELRARQESSEIPPEGLAVHGHPPLSVFNN